MRARVAREVWASAATLGPVPPSALLRSLRRRPGRRAPLPPLTLTPLLFSATPPLPLPAACIVRNQIREKYNLPVQCELDCCLHYFCGPCALCQEFKELRQRVGGPVPVHSKMAVEPPTWAPPPRV